MMSSSFTSNASKNTSNSKRILLVDDEADVISLFKMVLEMNGFEIDAYSDPEAALSNFKPNSYGLALLDIRMAPLNGFELYKKMKNIDGSLKACFITAFEDYRQEFKESFPQLDELKCFIRKQKAIEDLVNHVATILG
ncbi:MAG: response regulator [Thermoproteota archaeon]|nr:response regulator [Thermoproteota archaeon]